MYKIARFIAFASVITSGVMCGAEEEEDTQVHYPDVIASNIAGDIVVDFVDGTSEMEISKVEKMIGVDLKWSSVYSQDEALTVGFAPNMADTIAKLSTLDIVEVAEPVVVYALESWPDSPPNDPLYSKQWHLEAMGAPYAWKVGATGKGVIVAVIDTGVSHVEDLDTARVLAGASFVPGEDQIDGNGHGTHVAGTIAQSTNNSVGTAGVAPEATILPVKVLADAGFGNSDWIASGIDYAVDEGAQVINLSLGGSYSAVIHNAVKKARAAGVIVVAACGNSAVAQCGYPGGLEETIGVSATGPDGKLSYYSSYGKGVTIAAPGGNKKIEGGGVWQNTVLDGTEGYYDFQGTSMATPHVAGALVSIISSGKTTAQAEKLMLSTARDGADKTKFGVGHLDLEAALQGNVPAPGGCQKAHSVHSLTEVNNLVLTFASICFTLLIAFTARAPARFTAIAAASASFFASGMWYLEYLPLPSWEPLLYVVSLLSVSPIVWPDLLFDGQWASFPLWLSALFPLTMGYVFGIHKTCRPYITGMLVGYATYFVWGLSSESVHIWWVPSLLNALWLSLNASLAAFFATALAGVENIDKEKLK